jgi:hypothetical protein
LAAGGAGSATHGNSRAGINGGPPYNTAINQAREVAALRERNRRRSRLIAQLRQIYALGPRATVEFIHGFPNFAGEIDLIEELAERYCARLDPALLRATGGDRFPATPIRLIGARGGAP